jgi:hypothetical protein
VRQRHSPPLEIDEISQVLAEGMESALQDRKSFATWRSTKIPRGDLEKWVDGPVADAWGPLAAARVYGISTTGIRRHRAHTGARLGRALQVGIADAGCYDALRRQPLARASTLRPVQLRGYGFRLGATPPALPSGWRGKQMGAEGTGHQARYVDVEIESRPGQGVAGRRDDRPRSPLPAGADRDVDAGDHAERHLLVGTVRRPPKIAVRG